MLLRSPSLTGTLQPASRPSHATFIASRARRAAKQALRASSSNIYDNPALYTNEDTFAESSYWDSRYRQEPNTTFEWYRGYSSLRPFVMRYLPRDRPVLQLGVGNSTIQYDMVLEDSYENIVNVDYSAVVVQQQQAAHGHIPQLKYLVADARDLTLVADSHSYASVLDKGTLDALLCGENDLEDSGLLLSEAVRVLQPQGVYLHISHAPPKSRLRYLQRAALGWSSIEVWEVGQQGRSHGPYNVPVTTDQVDTPALTDNLELPQAQEVFSHWVYACRKA